MFYSLLKISDLDEFLNIVENDIFNSNYAYLKIKIKTVNKGKITYFLLKMWQNLRFCKEDTQGINSFVSTVPRFLFLRVKPGLEM